MVTSFSQYLSEAKVKITANRGDVAEAILGAGLAAFFSKRPPEWITNQDIDKMLDMALSGKNEIKAKDLSYVDNKVEDRIHFKMAIPQKAKEFIADPTNRELVSDLYDSVTGYVNGNKEFIDWSLKLADNDSVDKIEILSDGTSDQKSTKADIKIFINGEIQTKQISLKVEGGDQFAQFGGSSFDTQLKLFQDSLGLSIKPLRSAYESALSRYDATARFADRGKQSQKMVAYLRSAANITYAEAYKQLTKVVNTKKFKEKLADFIRHGATLSDPSIVLVKLEKSSFKSRDFGETFTDAIVGLNLSVMFKPGDSPQIVINAEWNGDNYPLITLRAKFETPSATTGGKKTYGTYMRNYIEAPSNSVLYKL